MYISIAYHPLEKGMIHIKPGESLYIPKVLMPDNLPKQREVNGKILSHNFDNSNSVQKQ